MMKGGAKGRKAGIPSEAGIPGVRRALSRKERRVKQDGSKEKDKRRKNGGEGRKPLIRRGKSSCRGKGPSSTTRGSERGTLRFSP